MKTIWTGRLAQGVGKYGEHAPMATVCCNACRTCVQANLAGVAMGGVLAAGALASRLAKRVRTLSV